MHIRSPFHHADQPVAANTTAGHPVTAPGLPPGVIKNPATFVTEDCIRPAG